MKRSLGWAFIVAGVLLDAAVILLPLTPYPLLQMTLDRDFYEVQRGYEHFLTTGKWEAGDRGFALMRQHYMEDVTRGLRPELTPDAMPGASLVTFRLADAKTPGELAEKNKVYVIYSNEQGHVVDGEPIKTLSGTFRKPYAMLVSVALLLLGTVWVYSGLWRVLKRENDAPAQQDEMPLSGSSAS